METYNGHVRTPTDAIILFEACRLGLLPRVQRRLSEKERQSIRSGSVFVWDEREAGMRRWTDGKSWSASRVSGSFLTYREMEGRRGGNAFVPPASHRRAKTPDSARNSGDDAQQQPEGEEGPDGYRYKPDGLMKQSFSITTSQGQHLHLISYYSRSHPTAQVLRQPSNDPSLSSITPPTGMYPESTVNDQSSVPAVTRSPMPGAPNYAVAPAPEYPRPPPHPHGYYPPPYMPHPAYMYPMPPMPNPPPHYPLHPYPPPPPNGLPPLGYPSGPYAQPHQMHLHPAHPAAYDQRPLRAGDPRAPAPPPPPSLQHHPDAAPPIARLGYAQSQPHPPPPLPPPNSSHAPPAEEAASAVPIDPRLTELVIEEPPQKNGVHLPKLDETRTEAKAPEGGQSAASQAPTINALMNNPATPVSQDKTAEVESDRQASTSPGGTKKTAPPQDIPSEKLGFREDKRVLRQLDSVFARV